MNDEKKIELNAWILEHVYGWKMGRGYGNGNGEWLLNGKVICSWELAPKPTTDPAAAFAVLQKCLERTGGMLTGIVFMGAEYRIKLLVNEHEESVRCETLEETICEYARQLFTKGK